MLRSVRHLLILAGLVVLGNGCPRAAGDQTARGPDAAAPTAEESGGTEEESVWSDDLPSSIEEQVGAAVARATNEQGLTDVDIQAMTQSLIEMPRNMSDLKEAVKGVLERTEPGRWRAVPSIAALLEHPDSNVRENAVILLGFVRTSFRNRVDADGEFDAEAHVPLLIRSTYDIDYKVQYMAVVGLGGVARMAHLTTPPECVFDRLHELTRDSSAGIAGCAARALYNAGRPDLLTPEQVEQVRRITEG